MIYCDMKFLLSPISSAKKGQKGISKSILMPSKYKHFLLRQVRHYNQLAPVQFHIPMLHVSVYLLANFILP